MLSEAMREKLDQERKESVKRKQLNVATTVHLSNLPYVSTEDDVRSWFEECGQIERVLLPIFSDSQKRRGYGFVEFKTSLAAAKALELDGLEQHNRVVRVNFANSPTKNGNDDRRAIPTGSPSYPPGRKAEQEHPEQRRKGDRLSKKQAKVLKQQKKVSR